MAFVPTPDDLKRYQENRRRKYRENADVRKAINERNKANYHANKDEINAKRRQRLADDPVIREKYRQWNRARALRNPNWQRDNQLKQNYGISLAQYERMVGDQNGLCALCGTPPKNGDVLCVDHCHATGTIRALLCRKCNTGLGCYNDNPALLQRAIEYLRRWRCQ